MIKRPNISIALMAAMLTVAGQAKANDATFGGAGGALAPLKETRVRMASEHITIEQSNRWEWSVTAKYTFENTTNQRVHLQMGFPELACQGDCDQEHPYTMHGLRTRVRNQATSTRKGKIDPKRKPSWAPTLGLIHLFDVSFEPNETVHVEHTYTHAMSTSVDGWSAVYLTRTGAAWNGPIGTAEFVIKHRIKHYTAKYPSDYTLVSRREMKVGQDNMWEYRFAMKNWTPRVDLNVFFGNEMMSPIDCPKPYDVQDLIQHEMKQGKSQTEAEQHAAATLFKKLSRERRIQCAHWPYAIHGKPFQNPALRTAFYPPPKTTPCRDCDPPKPAEWNEIHLAHQPNPTYSDALLDEDDQRYLRVSAPK